MWPVSRSLDSAPTWCLETARWTWQVSRACECQAQLNAARKVTRTSGRKVTKQPRLLRSFESAYFLCASQRNVWQMDVLRRKEEAAKSRNRPFQTARSRDAHKPTSAHTPSITRFAYLAVRPQVSAAVASSFRTAVRRTSRQSRCSRLSPTSKLPSTRSTRRSRQPTDVSMHWRTWSSPS